MDQCAENSLPFQYYCLAKQVWSHAAVQWSKLNERLSRVVVDAAAGKLLQYRRGDDKYQQLHAELVQLGEELPQLQDMVLSDRTWEVSCGARVPCVHDTAEHMF